MQSKNGKKQEEDEGHLIVVILLLKKVVAEPLLSLFFFRLGADWILLKSTHVFFFVFFVVWKLTVVSRRKRPRTHFSPQDSTRIQKGGASVATRHKQRRNFEKGNSHLLIVK